MDEEEDGGGDDYIEFEDEDIDRIWRIAAEEVQFRHRFQQICHSSDRINRQLLLTIELGSLQFSFG
jgi:hypothetical protein